MFGCLLFLMRYRKGVNLDWRCGEMELGEIKERKTEIRIYCTRKENHFSFNKR